MTNITNLSKTRKFIGQSGPRLNQHFVKMTPEIEDASLNALQSSHNWVQWFLSYNKNTVRFEGDLIRIEGTSPDTDPFDEIFIAYQQHYLDFVAFQNQNRRREKTPTKLLFVDIQRAVNKAQSDHKVLVMSQLIEKLEYNPTVKFDMVAALRTLNPSADEDLDLAARALTHLLINVKRRLRGLPTTSELFFILYSTTNGTGKSLFIKRLGEVFGPMFEGGLGLSLFSSKFDRHIMTSKFLIEIDELKGATHSDMTEIKSCITGANARVEKKGKDSIHKRLVSSFIGSSNHDIKSVLFDTTGMRRFYQFHIGETALTESQAQPIKDIDFLAMLQSLNEFDYNYVSQLTLDLQVAQEGYKSLTHTEEFLRDMNVGRAPVGNYREWKESSYTTVIALYKLFREYSAEMGKVKIIPKDKFESQLKVLGYESTKKVVPLGHKQYKKPAVGDVCRKKDAICLPLVDIRAAFKSAINPDLADESPSKACLYNDSF